MVSYKCPCCGAPLRFGSVSQKMECASCSNSFDVSTLEKLDDSKADTASGEWGAYGADSGSGDWREGEADNLHIYSCISCGAEIVANEVTAATRCPYCDNEVIFTSQLSGVYRPDFVLPFKIDAETAKAELKKQCKGKHLLPKDFLTSHKIDEIKGVYVPFWLYDCDIEAEVDFNATRVRVWSDGKYKYTETQHYLVEREGFIAFDKIPVDGSTHMDDSYMESIEPYDYSALKDFAMPYLSGFLAEKYDVTAEKANVRADQRLRNSTVNEFAASVSGYASVMPRGSKIKLGETKTHYALMPVWMLSASYNGKTYLYSMNGQTGRFTGEFPVSKKKCWAWRLGITAILGVILNLIAQLM